MFWKILIRTFTLVLQALNFWHVPLICIFSAFVEIIGVFGVIGLSIGGDPSAEFGFAFDVIGDRASRTGVSSDTNRLSLPNASLSSSLVGEAKCRF